MTDPAHRPAREIEPRRSIPVLLATRRAAAIFVGTVFAATVVQVLAVPLAALADGRGEWPLPIPFPATCVLLIVGCAVQAAVLPLSGRWAFLAPAGAAAVYLALSIGLGVPTWLNGMQLVVALALFLFATQASALRALICLIAVVSVCVIVLFAWLESIGTETGIAAGFVVSVGVGLVAPSAGATALGIWWTVQTRKLTLAHEQAELARQEHDQRVKQAQEEERARIAQELHDVAGQHLAGLVTLADAAVNLAPKRLDEALHLVDEVRLEGRFAAASLAGALADLRASGTVPRETTPDLRRADELVSYWRRHGMQIDSTVTGGLEEVPAVVSTTGYRVLQEALTNAAKHAAGAPTVVQIVTTPSALHLVVENGPALPRAEGLASVGLGWGLSGIRERVSLLKGTMTADTTPEGGWRLTVEVPTSTSTT